MLVDLIQIWNYIVSRALLTTAMIEAKHDDTAHKPSAKFGAENTSYDQLIDIWLRSTRSQRETTKQAYRNTLFDFAEFVT